MLITNFGDLKAVLTSYMFHARFVPNYDLATAHFEAAANRRLRVRQMETATPLTTVNGDVALPADYLVWRTVLWTGRKPSPELDYVHPAYLTSSQVSTTGGDPVLFTIESNTFKTRPVSDGYPYDFHYYQKIPTITGANTDSNWLLLTYPDAYEFGVIAELFALGRNLEGAQLWKARRDETLAEIIHLSALTTGATSPKVRTAEYF